MQQKFVLKKSLFTTKYKNQGSQMVLATPVRSFYLQNGLLKSVVWRTNKTGQNMPREVPDATSCNLNFKKFPGEDPPPLLPRGRGGGNPQPSLAHPLYPVALSSEPYLRIGFEIIIRFCNKKKPQ